MKRLLISIFGRKKKPVINWAASLIEHDPTGAARVVAVPADGSSRLDMSKRNKAGSYGVPVIPHANLVKVLPNGKLYLYHTINPDLGIPLTAEGRMIVIQ